MIAGVMGGRKGPTRTFSPMRILDLHLNAHGITNLTLPDGWNTALVVLKGTAQVNGQEVVREAQLEVLDAKGENGLSKQITTLLCWDSAGSRSTSRLPATDLLL